MPENVGIIYASDGTYVQVTAVQGKTGYSLKKKSKWNTTNALKRFLLLTKGVYVGCSTRWIKKTSILVRSDIKLVSTGDLFNVCTYNSDLQLHNSLLVNNCIGAVSDEIFLTTLPVYIEKVESSSFLTIFAGTEGYLIGVTIENRLIISVRIQDTSEHGLSGIMSRLERYWAIQSTATTLPDTIFWIGIRERIPENVFKNTPHVISLGTDFDSDQSALKAAGVALCHGERHIPLFSPATPASRFRKLRAYAYMFSLLVLLCILAVWVNLGAWYLMQNLTLKRYQDHYFEQIIDNNSIITLTRSTNAVIRRYTRTHRIFSNRVPWGDFLEALGRYKTNDLHIDRLGTKLQSQKSQSPEIALTGWTKRRESVTDFIEQLKKMPFTKNIKLLSIEREAKINTFRFKILCMIQAH